MPRPQRTLNFLHAIYITRGPHGIVCHNLHIREAIVRLQYPNDNTVLGHISKRCISDFLTRYMRRIKKVWTSSLQPPIFEGRHHVVLDIVSAFDNASHESVIRALEKRNVAAPMLLRIRIAKTTVGRARGCPQGEVLPPLLWSLVVDPP